MGIDTPSDKFYTINTNTNQSGLPMPDTHKLHHRLLRPNQTPNTFPKKQTKQKVDLSYLLARTYLQPLCQETKDALKI